MEKFLRRIADSQAFEPEDKLSDIVNKYTVDELNEESLDLVYAARKVDYQEFVKHIEERKKEK